MIEHDYDPKTDACRICGLSYSRMDDVGDQACWPTWGVVFCDGERRLGSLRQFIVAAPDGARAKEMWREAYPGMTFISRRQVAPDYGETGFRPVPR